MFSMRTIRQALLASVCMLALPPPSMAEGPHDHAARPGAAGRYGQVDFPVACSPKAQQDFEHAAAMLHSFHFPATGKAFTAITEAEPDCAMAWWGIAISQRLNPLLPPFGPEALRRGWQAIERARAAPPRTERERDWIEAMAAFFQDSEHVDQHTRTLAYEAAMQRLAAKYPDDDEAQIFYALSINEAVATAVWWPAWQPQTRCAGPPWPAPGRAQGKAWRPTAKAGPGAAWPKRQPAHAHGRVRRKSAKPPLHPPVWRRLRGPAAC